MIRFVSSSILAGLVFAASANACGFHNYTPQPTLVNRLLVSDDIVLARMAPDNPFQFQAFEALEGNLGAAEIPYLIDATTRRRLALDSNAAVLFARDGSYGPWKRLAFVDAALAPVLRTVMENLPAWEVGGDDHRLGYFATLLGHPDDRIHRLALRELDLADYSLLRDLDLDLAPSRLLVQFDSPMESEFKPIRILLLGLSGEKQQRARLESGLENSVRAEGRFLGAYATALIELVGPEAINDIASVYLTDRDLPLVARELLIEAISLHGQTGDRVMEEAISVAIESSLWLDPGLAGAVARRFGSRGDWSHHSALQALLMEGAVHAPADKQDVSQYVMLAQNSIEEH